MPASIWEETDLVDATLAEKAEFWRELLGVSVEELRNGGDLNLELEPVLREARVPPRIANVLRLGRTHPLWHEIDLTPGVEALREQVLNASDAQIVGYAEKHYARLPTSQAGWKRFRWGLPSWR